MSADKSFRNELLARYGETQARQASPAVYEDPSVAWPYYEANYRSMLEPLSREIRICEVGSGHGSLLAWLRSTGFQHVEGVDASPSDVAFANSHLGQGVVVLGEAATFLDGRRVDFDLVIMKAVLEHVAKGELGELLRLIARSLAPGGCLLVDVPNMDWLLASHERYMDLTHEVGFTRESLGALLSIVFADVSVRGSRLARPSRSQRWFRRPLVAVLRRAFYVLGEGASDILFESRSLIAVARSPR